MSEDEDDKERNPKSKTKKQTATSVISHKTNSKKAKVAIMNIADSFKMKIASGPLDQKGFCRYPTDLNNSPMNSSKCRANPLISFHSFTPDINEIQSALKFTWIQYLSFKL
jgi:hypothetical protein